MKRCVWDILRGSQRLASWPTNLELHARARFCESKSEIGMEMLGFRLQFIIIIPDFQQEQLSTKIHEQGIIVFI